MYCFTYASSYDCIFNELLLWSEISSEHPVFIKTVAELSGIKLPQDMESRLMNVNKDFSELKEKVLQAREVLAFNCYYRMEVGSEIKKLIIEFIRMDENFISLLAKVRNVAPEEKVWQTLLEHITEEQIFMKNIFENLKLQVF
ncbi:DUF2935 domain-containing protein [Clostridium thermarum]|uniref:DUF2935 domain-containing protein n=1 Tax=Clostridium thermarum TaxID=1716543 RepID=UPI0013CFA41F|nr:DUF2935 domain-containing protein [Clostridium thermarum]